MSRVKLVFVVITILFAILLIIRAFWPNSNIKPVTPNLSLGDYERDWQSHGNLRPIGQRQVFDIEVKNAKWVSLPKGQAINNYDDWVFIKNASSDSINKEGPISYELSKGKLKLVMLSDVKTDSYKNAREVRRYYSTAYKTSEGDIVGDHVPFHYINNELVNKRCHHRNNECQSIYTSEAEEWSQFQKMIHQFLISNDIRDQVELIQVNALPAFEPANLNYYQLAAPVLDTYTWLFYDFDKLIKKTNDFNGLETIDNKVADEGYKYLDVDYFASLSVMDWLSHSDIMDLPLVRKAVKEAQTTKPDLMDRGSPYFSLRTKSHLTPFPYVFLLDENNRIVADMAAIRAYGESHGSKFSDNDAFFNRKGWLEEYTVAMHFMKVFDLDYEESMTRWHDAVYHPEKYPGAVEVSCTPRTHGAKGDCFNVEFNLRPSVHRIYSNFGSRLKNPVVDKY